MSSALQRHFRDRLSLIEQETKQLNEQTEEYRILRRDAERWRMLQREARVNNNINNNMGWCINIYAQQGEYLHYHLSSAVDAMIQAQLDRDGQLPEVSQ